MSVLSSGRFPLRPDFRRSYASIELREVEPGDPYHSAGEYEALLPVLKRFFYLETKILDGQIAALHTQTSPGQNEKSLSNLKTHLVASYHVLNAQEAALKTTTLTSLIEFAVCTCVSAALGILVYMQGSRKWTSIASVTLFGLCLVYKILDYASYIPDSLFNISEADYKRLAMEARSRNSNIEYRGETSRIFETE